MDSLDLKQFIRLFKNNNVFSSEDVNAQRDKLNKKEDMWIKETPDMYELSEFRLKKDKHRYRVSVDDVPFECLYLPSNSDRLLVHLNGGGATSRRYPNFLRWKYKNYFNAHYLSIDDPMYHFHPDIVHVMWYYGDKNVSYAQLLTEIVEKVSVQLGIDHDNIIFLGSSGGGTAALHCAERMDYTSAVAVNPQIILGDWQYPSIYDNFMKWGVDLKAEDSLNRNRVTLKNETCAYALCYNLSSPKDFVHYDDFCKRHDIAPRYGFYNKGNILMWTHATNYENLDSHAIVPERTGLSLLLYLVSQLKQNPKLNLNKLQDAGIAVNEVLNEYYQTVNEIRERSENYENFILDLMTPYISDYIKKIFSSVGSNKEAEVVSCYRNSFSKNFYINGNDSFFYNILVVDRNWNFRLMYDRTLCDEKIAEKFNDLFKSLSGSPLNASHYKSSRYHVVSSRFTADTFKEMSEKFIDATLPRIVDIADI